MKDTVRIVVADDEPIIRIDLCQLLEELGHQVVGQAADGFDALECCRRSRPDLAILDIRMPVFDGLSAAQSILEEGAAGGVILLTAFLDDELISRATAIGVSGYLVKPIERRMLQPTLQVALAQNRRLAQARQEIEATEEKLAQAKVVDRAKAVLAAREGISEAEAYRKLQKLAMDKQSTLLRMAEFVLEQYGPQRALRQAKARLMASQHWSEEKAYRMIRSYANKRRLSLEAAALRLEEELKHGR